MTETGPKMQSTQRDRDGRPKESFGMIKKQVAAIDIYTCPQEPNSDVRLTRYEGVRESDA